MAALIGWAVWVKQHDPKVDLGYMGGILWPIFGLVLSGMIATPLGIVFGGCVAVVQRRRHERRSTIAEYGRDH